MTSLKVIFRRFAKSKLYTGLNLIGLAFGVATILIVMLYVQDDMRYDRYHTNEDKIYRIRGTLEVDNNVIPTASVSPAMGPLLVEIYPEIKDYARFQRIAQNQLVKIEEEYFYENNFFYGDSSAFEIFDHSFIYGQPKWALHEINSIVLTERISKKYFGDINPIGKTLEIGEVLYKVTAVLHDLPSYSHLKFEALASFPKFEYGNKPGEGDYIFIPVCYTYLQFHEASDADNFLAKFDQFKSQYMDDFLKEANADWIPSLDKLSETHFIEETLGDEPKGSKLYLNIISIIGFLVLLLSVINYMNMEMVRLMKRAKEIGVRKILGSSKISLIKDILNESVLVTITSLAAGFIIAQLVLNNTSFNESVGKNLAINFGSNWIFLVIGSSILVIIVILIVVLYLSIYLSRMSMLTAIAGGRGTGYNPVAIRKSMVGFQIIVSAVMIICTIIFYRQLNFVIDKDLGFDKEHVALLKVNNTFTYDLQPIKNALIGYPGIKSISASDNVPGEMYIAMISIEGNEGMTDHGFISLRVSYDFLKTMGIKLVQGRDFDIKSGSDQTQAFMVNESAVKFMEWQDPIGKRITYNDGWTDLDGKVIGVVKDFNQNSLRETIEPMFIFLQTVPRNILYLKLAENSHSESAGFVREKWDELFPNVPIDYSYLSDKLESLYQMEYRIGRFVSYLAVICVVIAFLGLFNLSSFVAGQRYKEISIRKISGASTLNIALLYYKGFTTVFLISALVATALSYYLVTIFINNFAYRIEIGILTYLLTISAVLLVLCIIISIQSYKLTVLKPIRFLRSE